MSLFSSLDTGYTGLNASQLQMGTVSQNIANANTEGYTRQRVITRAEEPLHSTPGDIGRGVKFVSVTRIHNEFVFGRLKNSSNALEYNTFSKQTLEEVARNFPDTKGVGLQDDMKNYFNSWNFLTSNPTSSAAKTDLAQNSITFADNIKDTRERVRAIQNSLNDQLKIHVDEVNSIGKKIADLNAQIGSIESIKSNHANDLRDERDKLELSLAKLLDISVFKGHMQSDVSIDRNLTDAGKDYHLNISGESFVDGASFHPLVITNDGNKSKYYSIYSESQDGTRYDVGAKIHGGKIGAILDLRGRMIDKDTSYPEDGTLQGYIKDLDVFAKGLIEKTNSVYAASAVKQMDSPSLKIDPSESLINSDYNFKKGSFNVVMYDNDGNEIGRKTITIDDDTTMDNGTDSSIVGQFNKSTDDNGDNNSTNDLDDYFKASYSATGVLSIQPKTSQGYKIAIEDNGTNFAGATAINNFFSGNDATNISLKQDFADNPSLINAYKNPVDGDNQVANEMLQIQYHKIEFKYSNTDIVNATPDGFYRKITAKIATDAQMSGKNQETSQAVYNAVNQEQQSISGVNIDEELANLLKYQTAYSANAKIISTIDRMLDALLSIKQ